MTIKATLASAMLLLGVFSLTAQDLNVIVDLDRVGFEKTNVKRGNHHRLLNPRQAYEEFVTTTQISIERGDDSKNLRVLKLPRDVFDSIARIKSTDKALVIPIKFLAQRDLTADIAQETQRLQQRSTALRNTIEALADVFNNKGKSITSHAQKTTIETLLDIITDEKLKEDIRKDLAKDKISKKVGSVIKAIYPSFNEEYMFAKVNLQALTSDNIEDRRAMALALKMFPDSKSARRDGSFGGFLTHDLTAPSHVLENDVRLQLREFKNFDNKENKETVFYDTIPNPFLPEELTYIPKNRSCLNEVLLHVGGEKWQWTQDEKGEQTSESYPVYVNYHKYESHPEYKVIHEAYSWNGNAVYDKNGALLALNIFEPRPFHFDAHSEFRSSSPIGRAIKRMAYKNNEYDIQSASAATKSYITDQLGLRKKTAAELRAQDKAASQMANALLKHSTADARHGSNTRAANRAKNQAAGSFLGAMLGASNFDSKGSSWLDQIEKDWTKKMGKYWEITPYIVERLNDTTYSIVYYDKDGKPVFKVVRTFENNGPFKYKTNDTVTIL